MPKDGKPHLTKMAPPPADLPIYQRADPAEVSFFGRTNFEAALQEKKFIFGIRRSDRTRHIVLVGKSGTGKSQLIEMLARQDIAYGKGLCVLDFSGETVASLLEWIPEARISDTVLIDPLERDYSLLFNPFAGVHPDLRYQVADGFTRIIEQQFGDRWTGELDHVTRMAVLAMLDYPRAALHGMHSLLTNERFRGDVVVHIKDPIVKRFWEHEFSSIEYRRIMPIANKIMQFLANPFLAHIISEGSSVLNFNECIGSNKIVLVNLSRAHLGEEGAAFLGGIFIMKFREAMSGRTSDSDPFYMYIDEFHMLVTKLFEQFFLDAHKNAIGLTLACQYIDQLPGRFWATLMGNTGTIVAFRTGGEDAERLEREFTPTFEAKDLMNLGTKAFYLKMSIHNETSEPFSAESLELHPPKNSSAREDIVRFVRRTYMFPREKK